MGNAREETMCRWLDKYDACLKVAYMHYLRREVSRHPFVDAGTINNYWEWCMDTCPR